MWKNPVRTEKTKQTTAATKKLNNNNNTQTGNQKPKSKSSLAFN